MTLGSKANLRLISPAVTGSVLRSYKGHLRLGKRVSGDDHKLDSVDLVRICGPVNISFSTRALENVIPFLKGSLNFKVGNGLE